MPVTVRSPLDITFWFLGRGDSSGTPLDAIALQNLLYLAQARWAGANGGQKLMPATFLATESGPVEPTIYHVFRSGPPALDFKAPHGAVAGFLDDVWERFGRLGAAHLGDIVRADPSFQSARAQGANEEIVFAAAPAASAARPPQLATKDGARATKWVPGQGRKNRGPRAPAEDPFANAPGNPATKFTPRRQS